MTTHVRAFARTKGFPRNLIGAGDQIKPQTALRSHRAYCLTRSQGEKFALLRPRSGVDFASSPMEIEPHARGLVKDLPSCEIGSRVLIASMDTQSDILCGCVHRHLFDLDPAKKFIVKMSNPVSPALLGCQSEPVGHAWPEWIVDKAATKPPGFDTVILVADILVDTAALITRLEGLYHRSRFLNAIVVTLAGAPMIQEELEAGLPHLNISVRAKTVVQQDDILKSPDSPEDLTTSISERFITPRSPFLNGHFQGFMIPIKVHLSSLERRGLTPVRSSDKVLVVGDRVSVWGAHLLGDALARTARYVSVCGISSHDLTTSRHLSSKHLVDADPNTPGWIYNTDLRSYDRVIFVSGTRKALCLPDELRSQINAELIHGPHEVHAV